MAYLQLDSVSKTFPGVKALDGITFGVSEGSVHALCGENGAGKSTLLKILSGVYRPDGGRVLLAGQPVAFAGTGAAIAAGVAVIYQELNLVPDMTVAENLYLGHLPQSGGMVNRAQLLEQAGARLAELGVDVSPRAKVGSLPIAQRQMVEIAKALSRNAKVIAFDEPTSSLSSREVESLFRIIRSLRDSNKVILYVSHRMDEIFEIADAVTVFRDGRLVETFPSAHDTDADTIVNRMVGRSIADIFNFRPRQQGEPALQVDRICGAGVPDPLDFTVRKGEIVGLFGLVGAGRTELLKLMYGATRPTGGQVRVEGQAVRVRRSSDAIRAGVMLCPEDRKKEGIFPVRSVSENINLSARRGFSSLGFLINESNERANAQRQVDALNIRTPSLKQEIGNLSGGNQQKVVLGRWLSETIKVILLDEPTRGIDVGAKSEIYAIIQRLADSGIGVVMASSELTEVLGICDRIDVMREGRIVASLPRAEGTEEGILKLALPTTTESRPNPTL
jgi:L-arabinose transport system ATP-binding protein